LKEPAPELVFLAIGVSIFARECIHRFPSDIAMR